MSFPITVHFENNQGFEVPHLWVWYDGLARADDFAPTGADAFGVVYRIAVRRPRFHFKFKEGPGTEGSWEPFGLDRLYRPLQATMETIVPNEIWCRGDKAFVYHVEPRMPEPEPAEIFLRQLSFKAGTYVPGTGGFSGLGANVLADGRVLFGFYHPNAARVYLMGRFNDWQRPGHKQADASQFIEMQLYRGYFGLPNSWLVVSDQARPGDAYKFFVQGGVPRDHKGRLQRYVVDPYARRLANDFQFNNPIVVDPTSFSWGDAAWTTPDPSQLRLYELNVPGFTEGDPDIQPTHHGKFRGITERIRAGYFARLGVTALALMPLAAFQSLQGPETSGYHPSLFCTVERDFGSPDDFRELVNEAHRHGLVVLLDQVFDHTDNGFNPLWQLILEHPNEESQGQGGLYFNGTTPWGNRLATEKADVQNMLLDACKLFLCEYHIDGIRFDATPSAYLDQGFLSRLAQELRGFKPDVLLVAKNLPNPVAPGIETAHEATALSQPIA